MTFGLPRQPPGLLVDLDVVQVIQVIDLFDLLDGVFGLRLGLASLAGGG